VTQRATGRVLAPRVCVVLLAAGLLLALATRAPNCIRHPGTAHARSGERFAKATRAKTWTRGNRRLIRGHKE
jgi:hypothetical protein